MVRKFHEVSATMFFLSLCRVFSTFWSFFSNLTKIISETLSKISLYPHQFRITSTFLYNVSITFLKSFKIFFSNSLKFVQNFLSIFQKFHRNISWTSTSWFQKSQKLSLKFMRYFPQIIWKFKGKSAKIIIFYNFSNIF